MSVTKRKLLDSSALLAYLNREAEFEAVRSLLRQARSSAEPLLLNDINLGEVFYVRARFSNLTAAEHFLQTLMTLPIRTISNSQADVLEAARLKAQYGIAYGDAFAIATAIRENATVVTRDREFHSVEHLVKIHWL